MCRRREERLVSVNGKSEKSGTLRRREIRSFSEILVLLLIDLSCINLFLLERAASIIIKWA